MKFIWLVAALGACVALTSCDDDTGQTAQKSVSVPAACPCHQGTGQDKTTVAQASPRARAHRHHQHHWHSAEQSTAQAGNAAASSQGSHVSADNTAPAANGASASGAQASQPPSAAASAQEAHMSADNAAPNTNHDSATEAQGRDAHDAEAGTANRHRYPHAMANRYRRNWDRHHPKPWSGRYASNWGDRRYARTTFTQSVLAPYNYVSQSHVTYIGSDAGYENGGYSRYTHSHPFRDTIAATMTRARLDPWHGYDVDCPWQYR